MISVGIAEVQENDDDETTFYSRTDKLLYNSKHTGKNKISF